MIGVYKIINELNGKVYVGSSINIESRWKSHIYELKNNVHKNEHLQNAWNKYGEENFKFEIIEECSEDNLRLREDYYIDLYKASNHNYGYNIFSCTNIGIATQLSDETRKKISIACSGERNGNYGRKHTPEELKIMRDNRWGINYIKKPRKKYIYHRIYTNEEIYKMNSERMKTNNPMSNPISREKLRESKLGTHHTKETRQKMSKNASGLGNNNSKLTKEQVLEIYNKMISGINYKIVSNEYNINPATAYKIKRREHWVFRDDK